MSSKEKKSKSTEASKKEKVPTKSVPTSAEYVVDSDIEADSGDEPADSSKKSASLSMNGAKVPKGTKRKAVDEPSSPRKKKASNLSKDKVNSNKAATNGSSQPSTKINGTSKPQMDHDTDSSDDSDSEAGQTSVVKSSKQTNAGSKKTTTKGSTSIISKLTADLDMSESSEVEISSEDVDMPDAVAEDETGQETEQVAAIPPSETNAEKVLPYRPPEGFSIATMNSDLTGSLRNIFSAENLQGKQIWHITAPSSVPFENIKKIVQSDLLSSKAVLSYQGSDYGFHIDNHQSAKSSILVPARKGSRYQPLAQDIKQTLHLRQIVKMPTAFAESSQTSRSSGSILGARKPILKQPEVLKLRYRPIGDDDSKVSVHAAVRQAKQRIDNTQIPLPPVARQLVSPKKSKKSKSNTAPTEEISEWVDPETYSAPVVVGSASQHTIDIPPEALGQESTSQVDGETAEEKARRKAEKAARKEARRKRKELEAHAEA